MLEMSRVSAAYGGIRALNEVDLVVRTGEIVTLIGANGAGKSSTLRAISGLLRARTGRICFQGREIQGLAPHEVASLGIGHIPEGRRIFGRLTVEENLNMGAYLVSDRREMARRRESIFGMFPRLAERRQQEGGTLSGGEQQMLAIGRALMQKPSLLLLDEPTMGLAPVLVDSIFRTVLDLNRSGMTILLVEQNAWSALRIADRGYVLQTGRLVLHGTGPELIANRMVQESYLGD
jgi:branched-chain amino acid transport system ATP-binding protein